MHFKYFSTIVLAAALPSVLAQTCTINSGRKGECITTSACSSNGGTSEAGHCPGATNIQCCTYGTCKSGAGICQPTSTCTGTSQAGLCPGPSHIQCCTPSSGGGSTLPGLNSVQSGHARTIISVAKSQGVGSRGCQVGIATAMQESSLRVLANTNVAESFNYPHDGTGSDHDSVGLFQQRPIYWGTVKDCMNPTSSSNKFFNALRAVSGWQTMSIAQAAQKVQKSAYPDAYAKWTTLATNVCNAGW